MGWGEHVGRGKLFAPVSAETVGSSSYGVMIQMQAPESSDTFSPLPSHKEPGPEGRGAREGEDGERCSCFPCR